MSYEACSDSVQLFAVIGVLVVAITLYLALFAITKEVILRIRGKRSMSELSRSEREEVYLYSAFWPITILVGIFYWIGKWLVLPFIAATKRDLKQTEQRLNQKIILNGITPKATTKFKVGDLIKGAKGNPDNYKHLNQGCLCKVLSINEKGSMELVLVDHKDFNKHKDVIGNVFKAPERNFVKAKKKRK